uniref:NOP9 nucleolar protein n=1 Tax=Eptatretus burgeri TaxID=7764 RepID=A0A8C4PXS9_EPTBU
MGSGWNKAHRERDREQRVQDQEGGGGRPRPLTYLFSKLELTRLPFFLTLPPPPFAELFFCNVLKEVEGFEISLTRDSGASRVLEQFLRVGPAACIEALLGPLCRAPPTVLCHCCVARVLETGLQQLPRLLRSETDLHQNLVELVVDLVNNVTPVLSEFACDIYGSFVLRTLLQLLSRFCVRTAVVGGIGICDGVPSTSLIFLSSFFHLHSFFFIHSVFVEEEAASHVLQTALLVLHARNASLSKFDLHAVPLTFAINCCFDSALLERFKDRTSSHVIEHLIEVADDEQLKILYKHHMRGNVPALALHPTANYTVQRFIGKCSERQLFKELVPWLEAVLAQGHMGIVTSLAEAVVRLQKRQDQLLETLLKVCFPYGTYHDVTYHGSVLVQNLLRFQDPALIVNGLLSLKPSLLLSLSCSQFGSRVVDVFFRSPTVSSQFHEEFLTILKVLFSMACTKHGSRVIDGIWTSVSLPQKQAMAQELALKHSELRQNQFGKHVERNCGLGHFLRRRGEWQEVQAQHSRKRRMLADILD